MTVRERTARVMDHLQWMTHAQIDCLLYKAEARLNAHFQGTEGIRLGIVVDVCLQLLTEIENAQPVQPVSPLLLIG